MGPGARSIPETDVIMTKVDRLQKANTLIEVIASTGRRFLCYGDRVAQLELDARGRVWFVDHYTGRRIYTHHPCVWRGFSSGETMRQFVEHLREYIFRGTLIPAWFFGPWPEWVSGGDLWGYGEDMEKVRRAAHELSRGDAS